MAVKKSELYSSLWASCDELRGGMDASQYKDYVLTMLFIKYVSDKYANRSDALIIVPDGASFDDMVSLKGQSDIGERINKEIIAPLFRANGLEGQMELVDFNDDDKLGSGKEKVDRLSNLVAIFENPALNFANNRAEDDDILGDAYEYLMRHFATQSGKSKGQFYTPAEVSRIMANIIEVDKADKPSYSVYDPTCGSGSLLLKVVDQSQSGLTIYGQEKDIATRSLCIMNMWLHGHPMAVIQGKDSISQPQFLEDGRLKRFDYVVANPPFSVKNWSNGIVPEEDEYNRFDGYGIPPSKNGDYAFLLHMIASLKRTGKAAVILPHGVLFRGHAEARIRENLIRRKLLKGIIGLPANLFYGTGIPACILVIDKEHTDDREGIFMIDASKAYIKDGNKNRLREQDIHKIVDVFNSSWEIEKYSRLVPFDEIEKNEYNLNIPRYIDTQEEEDKQDLDAHLNGGIPNRDIEALEEYWKVYPQLKEDLFESLRPGYSKLKIDPKNIKDAIFEHPEFKAYSEKLNSYFDQWKEGVTDRLREIDEHTSPKKLITGISESILEQYSNRPLIIRYDVYQHLLDYWLETMKDDVYLIIEDGWTAKVDRVMVKGKDKGWTCELIPKELVLNSSYLNDRMRELHRVKSEMDQQHAHMTEMEEEYGGEDALLSEATNDKGSFTKTNVNNFLKEIKDDPEEKEAYDLLLKVKKLYENISDLKKEVKKAEADLDAAALKRYRELTREDVQTLVIEDKWMQGIREKIQGEIDSISQTLTGRIKELAERYAHTVTELDEEVEGLEVKVATHLEKMGLSWK